MFLFHTCSFFSPAHAANENQPVSDSRHNPPVSEPYPIARSIEPAAVSLDRPSVDYLKAVFVDTGKILASPLHADSSDWLKAGGVVAITGGLFLVDANIRDFSQRNHGQAANKIASAGQILGNPLYTLPPVGAFYLYGYLTDDSKAQKTSLLAVESLAISSLFTGLLKVIAQRDRPGSGASPYKWEGPRFNLNNLSFCSGHTSSAFSIATVFAEQYKNSPYVPPIAYGLATLAGLSRVYDNKHWASDVFFGAALGYFVGKSVVNFHSDHLLNVANLSLVPDVRPNYNGITLQYKY